MLFIKPWEHRILKSFQKKKNATAGILHIGVGINGCDMVQNLFYEGMRIKISSLPFPKTTQNDRPT